jgi:hypothetical protein
MASGWRRTNSVARLGRTSISRSAYPRSKAMFRAFDVAEIA